MIKANYLNYQYNCLQPSTLWEDVFVDKSPNSHPPNGQRLQPMNNKFKNYFNHLLNSIGLTFFQF